MLKSREENPQSTILYNYPECLVEPLNCKIISKTIDAHLLVAVIKQFLLGLLDNFKIFLIYQYIMFSLNKIKKLIKIVQLFYFKGNILAFYYKKYNNRMKCALTMLLPLKSHYWQFLISMWSLTKYFDLRYKTMLCKPSTL